MLDAATSTSNAPCSAIHVALRSSQKLNAYLSSTTLSVSAAPGASSAVLANAFSSFLGRGTDDATSVMYTCAASRPATAPVFVTVNVAVYVSASVLVSFKLEYAKVV